jgi:hypothetical protein
MDTGMVRSPPFPQPIACSSPSLEGAEADPLHGQSGQEEDKMGHSEFDPAIRDRRPWNVGRMVGAKRALKPQQVWAVRFWLDRERRLRDRALFDLAIDSKLRGCDIVKIRLGENESHCYATENRPAGPVRVARSGSLQSPDLAGTKRRYARRLRLPEQDRPREAH